MSVPPADINFQYYSYPGQPTAWHASPLQTPSGALQLQQLPDVTAQASNINDTGNYLHAPAPPPGPPHPFPGSYAPIHAAPSLYHQFYAVPPPPLANHVHQPLQDTTSNVVNSSQPSGARGRGAKRKGTTSTPKRKRRKTASATAINVQIVTSAAPVCGVGPTDSDPEVTVAAADTPVPQTNTTSAAEVPPPPLHSYTTEQAVPRQREESKSAATDVWFFLRALNTREEPEIWPTNEPRLTSKPDSKFVGCRLW
jgi:hypothetical protein